MFDEIGLREDFRDDAADDDDDIRRPHSIQLKKCLYEMQRHSRNGASYGNAIKLVGNKLSTFPRSSTHLVPPFEHRNS